MNSLQELGKEIFKVAHLTGEFKLRSGLISNEYFDKYQFESNPHLLRSISLHFTEVLKHLNYDYLAALEMGGIPIASAISILNNDFICFVRKSAKEYGTSKLAEGPSISGKKLLIVEDVVTSGGQIIISANELRNLGAEITDAICVIDRESGGREKLEAEGIRLHSLFTMSQLKDLA